jgi:predicted MFS family arabinose efflux permease
MNELPAEPKRRLFEGVTTYHWLVLIIASCGWLFDCMDQRIFVLGRESAVKSLLPEGTADIDRVSKEYIGWATMWMIFGWATGGIIFGSLSDKLGRVKTMVLTLLVYSSFTGLSAASTSTWDFTVYRFLVGLGIGGMFGAAAALVAESVPANVRSLALGSLQTLSATGNILGSLIGLVLPPGGMVNFLGYDMEGWRALFLVGVLPALLVVPIIFVLREPEAWKVARAKTLSGEDARAMGKIPDLFSHETWRHRTFVGLALGVSGMIGLWGIGFYTPELISSALKGLPQSEVDHVRSVALALQDVGAFLGMFAFTMIATFVGRRAAFLVSFIACFIVVASVFLSLRSAANAYWMLPLVGFCTLMPFGGYSIYFPELYPTRLRGVGIGFCYNVGRYITAPSAFFLVYLSSRLSEFGYAEPFRAAAVMMCSVYFVGIIALIWAPETKGQPLPEED